MTMKPMTIHMEKGGWGGDPREELTVTVTFVEREHWLRRDSEHGTMKAYDVFEGDTHLGYIERAIESTDRHYGRIRSPGKGRPAWQYRGKDGRPSSSPGLYSPNIARAVGGLYGFHYGATKVS